MFNRLNVSRADISCVLQNDVRETARSTQPVTLYVSVKITPPTLYSSAPSIPTEDDGSPGRIQSLEHPLHLSHHRPVEAGNNKPQSREEASPASAKDLHLALDQSDQAIKRIGRSNAWQGAVGRIKWVMDTLSPIAEVRVIPS